MNVECQGKPVSKALFPFNLEKQSLFVVGWHNNNELHFFVVSEVSLFCVRGFGFLFCVAAGPLTSSFGFPVLAMEPTPLK